MDTYNHISESFRERLGTMWEPFGIHLDGIWEPKAREARNQQNMSRHQWFIEQSMVSQAVGTYAVPYIDKYYEILSDIDQLLTDIY